MPLFSDCHGCALCLLSCPMWQQQRDVRFSPQGIAKALQFGADAEDLSEQLSACLMCGACDLFCPEKIDLTDMISTLLPEHQSKLGSDPLGSDPFAMSCELAGLKQLSADDLYIIDARPFHAHHAERVGHYDALRQATGCSMNLDLNRMAIPTGIGSLADQKQGFDVKKQIEWLIQGRDFKRVIVENMADRSMLAEITGKPVMHLNELIGGGHGA